MVPLTSEPVTVHSTTQQAVTAAAAPHRLRLAGSTGRPGPGHLAAGYRSTRGPGGRLHAI